MMTVTKKLYCERIAPHEQNVDPESRLAVLQDLLLSGAGRLTRLLPDECPRRNTEQRKDGAE